MQTSLVVIKTLRRKKNVQYIYTYIECSADVKWEEIRSNKKKATIFAAFESVFAGVNTENDFRNIGSIVNITQYAKDGCCLYFHSLVHPSRLTVVKGI